MSKLTLEEAISHCLEVAEENDLAAGTYELLAENNHNAYEKLTAETNSSRCAECAADHRQLAEWLTELKQWRRVYGVCPSYEMCIPECREGYDAQIAEYKRLLKSATNVLKRFKPCDGDYDCSECIHRRRNCDYDDRFKWRYADEALKLLNDEK